MNRVYQAGIVTIANVMLMFFIMWLVITYG